MIWLLKDNKKGEVFRFSHPSEDWEVALKAYIKSNSPNLTRKEVDYAANSFNGEIWPTTNVIDITL